MKTVKITEEQAIEIFKKDDIGFYPFRIINDSGKDLIKKNG